jgi:hypothetical protein
MAKRTRRATSRSTKAKSRGTKSSSTKSTRAKSGRASSQARSGRKWSKRVTERSDALDLSEGVFELEDPRKIALSLKRSAERSRRRKSEPYRSAMSMLTFYVNRAGKNLPTSRKRVLQRAKDELREVFGRM